MNRKLRCPRATYVWAVAAMLGVAVVAAGCFGSAPPQRRYYTLHVLPVHNPTKVHIAGAAYVRDLNAESAYDKFQIVVRTSPFELAYRDTQVWAVRPNRMVSDLIARALLERNVFDAVTRELGSQRPDYILGGDLHAIEVYDSDDFWYAHLALSLNVTDFASGEIIWTKSLDERKQVYGSDFSSVTRALSELLSEGIEAGVEELGAAAAARGEGAGGASGIESGAKSGLKGSIAAPPAPASTTAKDEAAAPHAIMVPERIP